MRKRKQKKQKRWKKNIGILKRELKKEGVKVKNNPQPSVSWETLFIVSKIESYINSLSNRVVAIGLAIITIIIAFGLALMSSL